MKTLQPIWLVTTPGGTVIEYDEPFNYDWTICSKVKYVPAPQELTDLERVANEIDDFRAEQAFNHGEIMSLLVTLLDRQRQSIS